MGLFNDAILYVPQRKVANPSGPNNQATKADRELIAKLSRLLDEHDVFLIARVEEVDPIQMKRIKQELEEKGEVFIAKNVSLNASVEISSSFVLI